jgi:hypothetical protein
MSGVVDGITCDDQGDRRHLETIGVIGIGMADIDRDNLVALKFERRVGQSFRNGQASSPANRHRELRTRGKSASEYSTPSHHKRSI